VRGYVGWPAAKSLRACRKAGSGACCDYGCAERYSFAFTITDVNVHKYAGPHGSTDTDVDAQSDQRRDSYRDRKPNGHCHSCRAA
jgi:hypothetical protein